MYTPKSFEEDDLAVLHALIRANPLGAWVTQCDGELVANHLPFLIDPTRGKHGTLVSHVARANAVWHSFSSSAESIVIFQGAEAYITPSWYPAKQEHGKVVPTWNYAVVHAHGMPRIIEDKDWLLAHVTELTNVHESAEALPWKVTDAPAGFIENLTAGIVGVEILITRLVGKWKANQNRSEADRVGVVAGLQTRDDPAAREMARLVKDRGK